MTRNSDTEKKIKELPENRFLKLINAGMDEFSIKGYDHASTNAMAKRAGMSKGLMFHYINSKKDFFLFLYDYTMRVVNDDFLDSVLFEEDDALERLRQIVFLKMELISKNPSLFDFLVVVHNTTSEDVRGVIDLKDVELKRTSFDRLLDNIDKSKFRDGLNITKVKKLLVWSVEGLSKKMQDETKGMKIPEIPYKKLIKEWEEYISILKNCYYK